MINDNNLDSRECVSRVLLRAATRAYGRNGGVTLRTALKNAMGVYSLEGFTVSEQMERFYKGLRKQFTLIPLYTAPRFTYSAFESYVVNDLMPILISLNLEEDDDA